MVHVYRYETSLFQSYVANISECTIHVVFLVWLLPTCLWNQKFVSQYESIYYTVEPGQYSNINSAEIGHAAALLGPCIRSTIARVIKIHVTGCSYNCIPWISQYHSLFNLLVIFYRRTACIIDNFVIQNQLR